MDIDTGGGEDSLSWLMLLELSSPISSMEQKTITQARTNSNIAWQGERGERRESRMKWEKFPIKIMNNWNELKCIFDYGFCTSSKDEAMKVESISSMKVTSFAELWAEDENGNAIER